MADAIVARWRSSPWPDGLSAADCFVSTDGSSVLTYIQWSSDAALRAAEGGPWASVCDEIEPLLGRRALAPATPFRLYRRVHGGTQALQTAVATCFPAATFEMADAAAARG